MKFGKVIKHEKARMPWFQANLIVDYRLVKRMCKRLAFMEALSNIQVFARRADDAILRCKHMPVSKLRDLTVLNATAVRKLCKKLDKRHNCKDAETWFLSACRYGCGITFLSPFRLNVLDSIQEQGMCEPSCSCCYGSDGKLLLLRCAHILCKDCYKKILLKKGPEEHCPVCRVGPIKASRITLEGPYHKEHEHDNAANPSTSGSELDITNSSAGVEMDDTPISQASRGRTRMNSIGSICSLGF